MSTLAASTKKLEKWSGRLNDKSSNVRREALKTVGQIAQTEPLLAITSLNTLALFVSEDKYSKDSNDVAYALWAIQDMPPHLILKSPQLVGALIEAPLKYDYNASVIANIFLALVKSSQLSVDSNFLQDIIRKSKSSTLLPHQGGRRDFMKIVDWADDNDAHVSASLPKRATEIKPGSKRSGSLDPSGDAELAPAFGNQRTALPQQDISVIAPFVLDHDQIRQKQAESENVSGYLSQFFNLEESENTQAFVTANSPVGGRIALRDLEPILFALALRLASQATWKRADAEALAGSLGLMVDGALEHLNDAALDEWDVLFAEGSDPIELSAEVIAGLAKQALAAASP